MTTVATLSVEVGANISDFTKNMNTVQTRIAGFGAELGKSVSGVGTTITNVGNQMSSIGNGINTAIAPLYDMATAGLDAAAGFEDIMVQLETFGGLAGEELEVVKQAALDMGAATKFSASDAANAMLELVKAGYSVDDSVTAAGSALTLAAIGGMSLESAAGIVSSTLSQFGLDVADAEDVVNILAQAANASRADVAGLGDSLQNVGVVAATMGFSMRETTAALAVMANAGIEGAEAGTQLKSMLLNLTTNDKAADMLNELGVSLYDASGNMKTMDTIVDELSTSMADFTPEEKTQALKDLGGAYGITALSALMAAGGTDAMIDSMIAAPGAADLAEKSMGTFNGTVESLKGSVETLMIQGLTPLMENVLTPLVGKITDVVNSLTDWAGKNPELASTIGGIVLGLGALGAGLAIAGPLVSGLGAAIGVFGTALKLALGPIGLLAIGITAIVALLNNPDVQNGLKAWEGVFDNFKIILGAIVEDIKSKLDDLAVGFRSAIRDINTVILDLQSKAAAVQIALGINVDANSAVVTDTTSDLQAIEIAKKLEADINASLSSGEPVSVDVPVLMNVDSLGETERLAKQIADPTAIQQAIDSAIASGDTETLTALLPISLALAEDPAIQMQSLLKESLEVGGPNGEDAFNALIPMATDLDIDVQDVVNQYDEQLKAAAASKTYDVTVTANVKVNTNVDMSGIDGAVQGAANGTIYGGGGGGGSSTPSAQSSGGGGGGRQSQFTVNSYGQAPADLVRLIRDSQQYVDA